MNIAVPASPTTQQENDPTQLSSTQIITQIVTPLPNQEQPTVSAPTPKPVAQSDSVNDDNQPNPEPNGSQFWVEVLDDRTGIRFAMPCFWIAEIPSGEQDPSGLGSFPIKNYTEEFVTSFGPKQGDLIWERRCHQDRYDLYQRRGPRLATWHNAREFAQRLDRGESEGIEVD